MATATKTVTIFDLTPEVIDLCITRRDSFTFGFIFEDDSGPIDFTGDAFLLTVNPAADGSGGDLFAIAQSNTLDATGLVQFLPSIVNLTQAAGAYFYDVQWTASGGDVRTLVKGGFRIDPDISD
jgi:hypothetical protein